MTLVLPAGDQLKQIHLDLNVAEDRLQEDLAHLKAWLAKQPHLPLIDDDHLLFGFLFGCKNSLERCKKVIDMYYTVRGVVPEFYSNRDPTRPEIQACFENCMQVPLPNLTPQGCRVTMHAFRDPNAPSFTAITTMKRMFLIAEIRLREDVCSGDVLVFDMQGATMAHLTQVSFPLARKFMICGQNAYPVRLREIHLLNCPSFLDKILSMFKPLMKEKLVERIHVHTDLASLHKFIPKDILPKDYGGEAGTMKEMNTEWRTKLESRRDWFIAEEAIKADESKRPGGKPVTSDDLFGLEGSFRQLNVD